MKEILKKANEIGFLIKETEVYKKFSVCESALKSDKDADDLLTRYGNLAQNIHQRKQLGEIIENFEYESLKELGEEIKERPVILEYLQAQGEYVRLLESIQREIGGSTDNF